MRPLSPNDVHELVEQGGAGALAADALTADALEEVGALVRELIARGQWGRRSLSMLVCIACQCYPELLRAILAARDKNGVQMPMQLVRDLGGVEAAAMRVNVRTLAVLFAHGADHTDADYVMRYVGSIGDTSLGLTPELRQLLVEHGATALPASA